MAISKMIYSQVIGPFVDPFWPELSNSVFKGYPCSSQSLIHHKFKQPAICSLPEWRIHLLICSNMLIDTDRSLVLSTTDLC
jgi:hypothetical protein